MTTTLVSLLERVANPDDGAAWKQFLGIYRPFINKQLRQFPQLRDQADDIAQEVVLVLMRELPTFERRNKGSFRLFLRKVTVHQLLIAARRMRKSPKPAGSVMGLLKNIKHLADPNSHASKRWDVEHEQIVLKKVIRIVKSEVQPETWNIFQRYVMENQPAASVASELGISLGSVYSIKTRIQRRMAAVAKGLID